jgi:peptide deformylase
MAIRNIRIWPDPELNVAAGPVAEVDDEIRELVADLFQTMYDANGVGLAATQIAVHKRVLVIDLDPHGQAKTDPDVRAELEAWGFPGPTAFINPEIVASEGDVLWDEGCLSVPGVTEAVRRKERVTVRALDRDGKTFELKADGLFAVAIQHEMDHLQGKVFVEYLSKLKRDVIRRKMNRLKVEAIDDGTGVAAPV